MRTSAPARSYLLSNGGRVGIEPVDPVPADVDGELVLPSEALVRLVYGRLDAERSDGVEVRSSTVSLDQLRLLFPGM